jgi:hypothetical protein
MATAAGIHCCSAAEQPLVLESNPSGVDGLTAASEFCVDEHAVLVFTLLLLLLLLLHLRLTCQTTMCSS